MGCCIRPLTAAVALAFVSSSGWQLAQAQALDEVVVKASKPATLPGASQVSDVAAQRAATNDTAALLKDLPGVSLYGAGAVSSLPAIHGLADDRLRIKVDGMDLIASCPNHMNPALSYLDPSQIGSLTVYAGISPVSLGGDSIGGSIIANTRAPEFAAPGDKALVKGEVGAFFRSNSHARGGNASATYATENVSLSYSGAYSEADNYKAGKDFKPFTASGRPSHDLARDEVGSSAYRSANHALDLAVKHDNHLFEAKLGYQNMPEQLYPNQRMDLLNNEQKRINLRWLGEFAWGRLDARAYHETVKHYMDFGADKQFQYSTAPGMPMHTEGKTTGAIVKAEIDLATHSLLRLGGEYQHYTLNDWWPPSGTGGMAPYTFININDGQRDRLALFGEWEKQLSPQWKTQLGVRYERVNTSTGQVHGYNQNSNPTTPGMSMMNQTNDAARFNTSANRDSTDNNWDATALAHYTLNTTQDIEFGLARKVRSPNLYERYSWSTANMMAIMNNFVGDGNGYIGNPDLKPEKAHTVSATFDWHDAERSRQLKLTPYYSYVADYIDAIQWDNASNTARAIPLRKQFTTLRYTNQTARLYGLDLSGQLPLGKTALGEFGLKGVLSYVRGKNTDTGDDLYNIMPFNAKLTLTHKTGGWDNALEIEGVTGKKKVSDARNEIQTGGYALVNLRASYSWQQVRLDVGVANLFDRGYAQPTGGTYTGQGTTMGINSIPWGIAVPGMGRSLYAGVNVKF